MLKLQVIHDMDSHVQNELTKYIHDLMIWFAKPFYMQLKVMFFKCILIFESIEIVRLFEFHLQKELNRIMDFLERCLWNDSDIITN